MAVRRFRLATPHGFSLWATVRSHGWSDLPPFDTDRTGHTLTIHLDRATATVRQEGAGLQVALGSKSPLPAPERRRAIAAIRSCLRFDLDLADFWEACERDPDLR